MGDQCKDPRVCDRATLDVLARNLQRLLYLDDGAWDADKEIDSGADFISDVSELMRRAGLDAACEVTESATKKG